MRSKQEKMCSMCQRGEPYLVIFFIPNKESFFKCATIYIYPTEKKRLEKNTTL